MEKAFKTYNGGKESNGTFQNIINHIPRCDRFVEVFAGNCTIARKINRPSVTVINDIDRSVYERLLKIATPSVIVENNCYQESIVKYDNAILQTFFYCDPPYLFSTRKSKRQLYKHDWTDQQHFDFLALAVSIKSNCMISHYPCEMYDTRLKNWRTFDFESTTRQGLRTERIYMNYDTPQILQDYRYIGKDYIERQQIKRKTQRLLKRLEALPSHERTALLSAIAEKFK